MQKYKVTLVINSHTYKPQRVFKYCRAIGLSEAWDMAKKICSQYNKEHRHNAVISGVVRN